MEKNTFAGKKVPLHIKKAYARGKKLLLDENKKNTSALEKNYFCTKKNTYAWVNNLKKFMFIF